MRSRTSRFSRQAEPAPTHQNDLNAPIDYDDMTFLDVDDIKSNPSVGNQSRKRSLNDGKPSATVLKKADIDKLMDTNRESVQSVSISVENKGYKLLQKFGYSASQGGLGKSNTGLAVPLIVTKRAADDRAGLGVLEQKRKIVELKVTKETLHVKMREDKVLDFKSEMISQQQILSTMKHLNDARKVIYELDFRSGIDENHLWPPPFDSTSEEPLEMRAIKRTEQYQTITSQLEESLLYLKDTYSYCVFCGFQYESREEFEQSCPGPSEDDH